MSLNDVKEFILIGGGGHCHSCINSIVLNQDKVIGILDSNQNNNILGYGIIGQDEDIPELAKLYPEANFIVCVGMVEANTLREKIYNKLVLMDVNRDSLISDSARVSSFCQVGDGCTILELASVNAKARIGENVIINTKANIEHDVLIGDNTHISTGVTVNGNAHIGKNCMIGSGAIILQGVNIADGVTIGAGSVVIKDITEAGTWVGCPAKKVK